MISDAYGLQYELKDIWRGAKNGTLECEISGYEKVLYLRNGLVVFATSGDPDDKLPSVLIRQGRFTEEQFEAAEPNFNDEISVGRNLIEMGLITQQELMEGAKAQVFTVFASCLKAASATFDFKEDELPENMVNLPLVFPRDFFKALLEIEDKSFVADQFGDGLNFIPEVKEGSGKLDWDAMALGNWAAPLYGMIDGEANYHHLAFEADVDEFQLQKFLYVLKFLGFITTRPDESIEEEDEPEVEDVRDDLSEALLHNEDLSKLNEVSMDETIALPAMKGMEEGGSMDVTMEISKEAMGFEPIVQQTEDEEDEEDEPSIDAALGLDDDVSDFAEDQEEDEGLDFGDDEETGAGLDDLDQITEQNFEEQLNRGIPDDVIMPDPEDLEDSEEIPAENANPRRHRLLLMAAAALITAGLLFLARPYLVKLYNPFEEDPVHQAMVEPSEEPAKQADEAVPVDDSSTADAVTDDATKVADGAETAEPQVQKEPPPSMVEPEKTVEDPVAANTDDTVEVEPVAVEQVAEKGDEPTTPVTGASSTPNGESTGTEYIKPPPNKAETIFRSPVAEGWDPSAGRPGQQRQARVNLPMPENEKGAVIQQADLAPVLETPPPKPKPRNQPRKETPLKQAPIREARPSRTPTSKQASSPAASDDGSAAALLASGQFESAANTWRQLRLPERDRYTLGVFLVCQRENLVKAQEAARGDSRFFVLPRQLGGKTCFWVCWGSYESRTDALLAKKTLPEGLNDTTTGVDPYRLSKLLD